MGVACGVYKYVTEKPEITIDTLKLRANRMLNATGKEGHAGARAPKCVSRGSSIHLTW